MKISVTQENLNKALNHILKATGIKPNIPVLANVLIRTEKGQISFSATDLDISITSVIGGEIGEEGELTVNARLLTEFVGQLSSNKIDLLQTGQTLEVKSVDNEAQLYLIPAEDFPTLPEVKGDPDLVVNALDLKDAITRTSVATAVDQSRPILTGLLLESTQRKMSLVGVDGFRLSKKTLKLQKEASEDANIVIPAKAMLELAKIIGDEAEEKDVVSIYVLKDKNEVLFKMNDVTLSSRLLEGEFPDYKKIIPVDNNVKMTIKKDVLAHSIKIASIFARNVIGNKTLFKVNAAEKELVLQAKVQDMGNNESKAEIETIEGEDFETAFNAKFLNDMLSTMKGDHIIFEVNGITAPGVFKDESDEDFLHIIMPMRIE